MYAKSRSTRALSKLPVLLVLGILVFEWYVYNFVFVPVSIEGKIGFVFSPLGIIAFNAIWLLAIASYLSSSLTDPGIVPEEWRALKLPVLQRANDLEDSRKWQSGQATWCWKCYDRRPVRAHHCSICDHCVMRMDHHCPWIGNCVGSGNHKFFFLFVFYTSLASIIICWSLWPCIQALLSSFFSMTPGTKAFFALEKAAVQSRLNPWLFNTAAVVPAVFAILLSCLFISHIALLAQNRTFLEAEYEGPSPYNLGFVDNAAQILGPPSLAWLVPLPLKQDKSRGTTFPVQEHPPGSVEARECNNTISQHLLGTPKESAVFCDLA